MDGIEMWKLLFFKFYGMVRNSVGALHFLIQVFRLCTCSPSSGFLWNETGEN